MVGQRRGVVFGLCALDVVSLAFTNKPQKGVLEQQYTGQCIHAALMAFIADLCQYKDSLGIYLNNNNNKPPFYIYTQNMLHGTLGEMLR